MTTPRPAGATITVVVVDDESLVASSLSTLLDLEEDLHVVATLGSGEELLDWWDAGHRAEVVVMDLQLGGIDGVETARRLGERGGDRERGGAGSDAAPGSSPTVSSPPAVSSPTASSPPAVLIVTSHGRPRQLKQALAAGVPGFVRKTSTAAEFATAVRTVRDGRRYLDPDLAAAAIGAGESPLTEREAEVLDAAGRGGSVEQIAATVHLAPGTTRNYLSSAMGKTGASTRFEAWRIARERDWL